MKPRSDRSRSVGRCVRLLLPFTLLFAACTDAPLPKPRGYFRLDLPPVSYQPWSGSCPFAAERPAYAQMIDRSRGGAMDADTACWTSMRFEQQRATVFMTYRHIRNDLPELINDAHAFKDKHEAKAVRIRTEQVVRGSARVYGDVFVVEGDVASPMVFYLTDSTTHFLYGSLYFDTRPNADSLAPVSARIRDDLRHFVHTLNWR